MTRKTNALILAAALASPLLASAQAAPELTLAAAAKQAGPVAVGGAVKVQGKVKAIDKQKRFVVVVGPKGREVLIQPEQKSATSSRSQRATWLL